MKSILLVAISIPVLLAQQRWGSVSTQTHDLVVSRIALPAAIAAFAVPDQYRPKGVMVSVRCKNENCGADAFVVSVIYKAASGVTFRRTQTINRNKAAGQFSTDIFQIDIGVEAPRLEVRDEVYFDIEVLDVDLG